MNARENALRIIRFEAPERVVSSIPCCDCTYFGADHQPLAGPGGHGSPVGTEWEDIWGVRWRKELDGVMGYVVHHPLSDLSRLDEMRWPDPDDPRLSGRIHEAAAAEADRDATFLQGRHRDTLWERAYMLAGMERMMMAFYDEPDAVRELLRRIMDFQIGIARHYLEAGTEIAGLGDDLASQKGPLFGPGILREFFLPEYKRLTSLYKERGVLISFHSCGNIEPIADFFIEIGVDVLNPVQATANDLDSLRRKTHGRLALHGGVSTGTVMSGPPEKIEAEVRRRLWQLGSCGGYFCAPDQHMPFPEENIRAFRESVERYGTYPIENPGRLAREEP